MDLIEYLKSQQVYVQMKERGNYYIECPRCHKENLSIQIDTGLWHCWTGNPPCGLKGNFTDLVRYLDLKDVPHSISFRNKESHPETKALSYNDYNYLERIKANRADLISWCVSRSLDVDMCQKNGVGFDKDRNAVVYTYFDEKARIIGYKVKSDQGQWIKGREPLLYCVDYKDLRKEKIILVEGEADALTLKGMGLPTVATLGASKDKGFPLLRDIRRVFIGYDMDEAGQSGARIAAAKLGLYKSRLVKWGDKDVNDWVRSGASKDDILGSLSNAEKFVEASSSFSAFDATREYFESHESGLRPRRSFGWPRLDEFTKGWGGGELIGVQAESNTGKTTWLLNVICNVSSQSVPVGFASLEEHPLYEITPKLYSCLLGKNLDTENTGVKDSALIHDQLSLIHLYRGPVTKSNVLDFVRECYFEHDCKMVCIDYFQLLVKNEESVQDVKETMFELKNLTNECPDLCLIVIIQPKQIGTIFTPGSGEPPKKPKLGGWSARGGSAINQTVDKMLCMSSVKGFPNITQYEYTKCRGHLNVSKSDWLNKITQLEYNHETLRMTEVDHLIYQ